MPSHTTRRDLEVAPPASSGRGRRPQRPWRSVEAGGQSLADETWRRLAVREGSKGPLVGEAGKRRVVSRNHRRQPGDEEILVVLRARARDNQQVMQVDDTLSKAVPETPLGECARVATAEHRLEACLQRSKSAAGLADDEGRQWTGWQQQHTLS